MRERWGAQGGWGSNSIVYSINIIFSVQGLLQGADHIFSSNFLCFLCIYPSISYVDSSLLHRSTNTYNQYVSFVPDSLYVFQVKCGGSQLVPFHPHDFLFGSLQFLSREKERIFGSFVGNFLDSDISTYLYCLSNDWHLVRSGGLFNISMWWCLLVNGVKIFTCFYTYYLHRSQAGTFFWLDIKYLQLLLLHIIYNPHKFL